MPLYEFACSRCQELYEDLQKAADAPPPCPSCGAKGKALMSVTSFHLKGGGWAANGYARSTKP